MIVQKMGHLITLQNKEMQLPRQNGHTRISLLAAPQCDGKNLLRLLLLEKSVTTFFAIPCPPNINGFESGLEVHTLNITLFSLH